MQWRTGTHITCVVMATILDLHNDMIYHFRTYAFFAKKARFSLIKSQKFCTYATFLEEKCHFINYFHYLLYACVNISQSCESNTFFWISIQNKYFFSKIFNCYSTFVFTKLIVLFFGNYLEFYTPQI